jgi:hypothetical protein
MPFFARFLHFLAVLALDVGAERRAISAPIVDCAAPKRYK